MVKIRAPLRRYDLRKRVASIRNQRVLTAAKLLTSNKFLPTSLRYFSNLEFKNKSRSRAEFKSAEYHITALQRSLAIAEKGLKEAKRARISHDRIMQIPLKEFDNAIETLEKKERLLRAEIERAKRIFRDWPTIKD